MIELKRIEIVKFGGLADFNLNFESGLNVFFAPNEWGKTTAAAFIKYLFYGFDAVRRRKDAQVEDSDRTAYIPWDSDGVAGSAVLSADGVEYTVERSTAGKKETVALYGPSGAKTDLCGLEPGEFLFGVSSDAFVRTAFVSQESIEVGQSDELETRLRNLVSSGDEKVSYEKALELLTKELKKYRAQRGAGAIAAAENKAFSLREEAQRCAAAHKAYIEARKRRQNTLKRLSQLDAEIEGLSAALAGVKEKEAEKRLARREEIGEQLARVEAKMQNLKAADEQKTESAKEILFVLGELERRRNELAEQAGRVSAVQNKAAPLCLTALAAVAVCAAAACAGAAVVAGMWISAVAAAASAAAAVVLFTKNAGAAKQAEKFAAAVREEDRKIDEKKELLVELCGSSERERVLAYVESALNDLRSRRELSGEAQVLRERLAAIGEVDEEELARLAEKRAGIPSSLLDKSEAEITLELNKKNRERAEFSALLDAVTEQIKPAQYSPALLEEQAAQLDESAAEMRRRADAIALAIELLKGAFEELQTKLAPAVADKAEHYFSIFTGGKYETMKVDHKFNILVKAEGALRPLGYFSAGTRDAAYLSLRLAVGDLIFNGKTAPAIFDDSFARVDDGRLEAALRALKSAADGRQIVIFSCHKREKEILARI